METMEVLKKRRSIRVYKDKPIPKDILEKLVDAARYAATARNIQPWQFVIVTRKDTLNKLGSLAENGRFISQSKACVVVFCSDTKYYLEDGCAATQNILLAATDLGLGSCWVAGDKKPYATEVRGLLNVPELFKLVSIIALGYPDGKDNFEIAVKKDLIKIIHWEKF